MFILEKKFRFEMAHRLSHGYDGKCAKIHGHSWNGSIFVGKRGDEILDEFGMLLDYGEIKKITQAVEDRYDHKIALSKRDPMLKGIMNMYVTQKITDAVVLCDENPTSEFLAREIDKLGEEFLKNKKLDLQGFYIAKVTVEETCTVSCLYSKFME